MHVHPDSAAHKLLASLRVPQRHRLRGFIHHRRAEVEMSQPDGLCPADFNQAPSSAMTHLYPKNNHLLPGARRRMEMLYAEKFHACFANSFTSRVLCSSDTIPNRFLSRALLILAALTLSGTFALAKSSGLPLENDLATQRYLAELVSSKMVRPGPRIATLSNQPGEGPTFHDPRLQRLNIGLTASAVGRRLHGRANSSQTLPVVMDAAY